MRLYQSLHQFYNSDEWKKFRKQLISERINKADGILYDEFDGKPLIQSYDIVLHHKKPLTMQNVNDYSVSFNRENIMIVSQRSHNEIQGIDIYKTAEYWSERADYIQPIVAS